MTITGSYRRNQRNFIRWKKWLLIELEHNSPDAFELKQMVLHVLENKKTDNEKKLNAKKYIIDKFDQEKNLNKYIQLIES